MYVRIAQFTGGDPATFDAEVQGIRAEIESVRGGGEPQAVPREFVDAVRRVLFLINRETGDSATVVFTDNEQDIQTVDRIMNAMSPQLADMGSRTQVGIYEVGLDEESMR
jgi:hypothetical protein